MHYHLGDNGTGLLLTEWMPCADGVPIVINNAPSGCAVRLSNNGRVYRYALRDGKCTIVEQLEGECRITVESQDRKQRWECESFVVSEKHGVKIAKGLSLRDVVASLRTELATVRSEFTALKIKISALNKKVDNTVDGHNFI